MNSVYLYNLLALTEYPYPQQEVAVREKQGWVLVILCFVTLTVNLIYMINGKF